MIYELPDKKLEIDDTSFIAQTADVMGDVKIGKHSSIWFQSVVRGDVYHIEIGEYTNVQDNCVLHVTTDKYAAILGNHITVGHHAVIHGATLEDHSFVGIGSIILDNVTVKPFGFVGAGCLVPPGFIVPEYSLVTGVPAKVKRELRPEEVEMIKNSSTKYAKLAGHYKNNLKPIV